MKKSKEKEELLSAARLREILDYDSNTGVFTWRIQQRRMKSGTIAGRKHSRGYIHIGIGGKLYYAHRLAWLYITGDWPIDQIDHINGNRSANWFSNLRQGNNSFNMKNQKQARNDNLSGLLGVSSTNEGFVAQIKVKGKSFRLGVFKDPKEAHEAYLQAKRELHDGCTI